ncbi:hypothetical protein B0T26DRAFT_677156 [Lasiosphaeria miniovina]|uniref:Uncharacterized protein n=1 Tax=Lasiosphaeria miniovina TaxID=1954250 RepID=A0AA40DTG5_9PEZI|nr:uncharacterized protein B0T26DRAFT_677156 [Lasiosphaeria miniovina]KAK0712732.1 hypothetical protein B0T26DRAFT_677156 [Lasiosphaeria miniovina]
MSWDNFKTFNSKLKGKDVFTSYTKDSATAFLKELAAKPGDYGITGEKHQKGVTSVWNSFFKDGLKASVDTAVSVSYCGATLNMRDVDAALGYVFSACPLPSSATPEDTYLPLLAIYCKFMSLLVDKDISGMQKPPYMACVVAGVPPSNGGTVALMFGATIRVTNKTTLQTFRFDQLKTAYANTDITKRAKIQSYGHCAETYPYICNQKLSGTPRVFQGKVRGMALVVGDVAAKTKFERSSFGDTLWRAPCENCVELPTLGGYVPYDCFPHSGYGEKSS